MSHEGHVCLPDACWMDLRGLSHGRPCTAPPALHLLWLTGGMYEVRQGMLTQCDSYSATATACSRYSHCRQRNSHCYCMLPLQPLPPAQQPLLMHATATAAAASATATANACSRYSHCRQSNSHCYCMFLLQPLPPAQQQDSKLTPHVPATATATACSRCIHRPPPFTLLEL